MNMTKSNSLNKTTRTVMSVGPQNDLFSQSVSNKNFEEGKRKLMESKSKRDNTDIITGKYNSLSILENSKTNIV